MKVYLDNCCYNRPYDDQSQLRISLEAQSKILIQEMIRNKTIELASSYVLLYENSRNPSDFRRNTILKYVKENVTTYIDVDCSDEAKTLADEIIATGVKTADAHHIACAIISKSDYFLTTDDRLLKYRSDRIQVINPTEFIQRWEVNAHDGYE